MITIKIKEVCETCIKRKTMYCPNSSKCYSTEDKPYYQNGITLLEENEKLKAELELYKGALHKENELEERTHKAMTLIQLIQMSDEIDWGDINTLINILKGEENE